MIGDTMLTQRRAKDRNSAYLDSVVCSEQDELRDLVPTETAWRVPVCAVAVGQLAPVCVAVVVESLSTRRRPAHFAAFLSFCQPMRVSTASAFARTEECLHFGVCRGRTGVVECAGAHGRCGRGGQRCDQSCAAVHREETVVNGEK